MKQSQKLATALLLATTLYSTTVLADTHGKDDTAQYAYSNPIADALMNGTPYVDIRYRLEHVDQAGFADEAKASTLRTRAGYKTGEAWGFSGVIEIEDIFHVGDDDYNSPINGNTSVPSVADAEGTEVNQAYITFSGIDDTVLTYGRQNVIRNNARFVGHVSWRQNSQTFDGVTASNTSLGDIELFYGYLYNVNRVFGEKSANSDFHGDIHLAEINYTGLDWAKLNTYAYFLDLENGAAVSSATYGASVNGKVAIDEDITGLYHLEYAHQKDHGDNTTDYSAGYYKIEPGISVGGLTVKVGYEVLESDGGTIAFSTPLATGHKFNGWADIFLSAPATGLEDLYASVAYKLSDTGNAWIDGTKTMLAYHDFSAETGGGDYGTEWNFDIQQIFNDQYSVGLRYANYDADGFSVDTEKMILSLGYKFKYKK